MAEPFLGEIRLLGFDFAPRGWAFCEGQLLPIAQNQALFSVVGTTYGGDGRVTFALPDLRGRIPVHPGADVPFGARLGTETVALVVPELPAHSHPVPTSNEVGVQADPSGLAPARTRRPLYAATGALTEMPADGVGLAGGNAPHNNLSPALVLRFAIALVGIFPARG